LQTRKPITDGSRVKHITQSTHATYVSNSLDNITYLPAQTTWQIHGFEPENETETKKSHTTPQKNTTSFHNVTFNSKPPCTADG